MMILSLAICSLSRAETAEKSFETFKKLMTEYVAKDDRSSNPNETDKLTNNLRNLVQKKLFDEYGYFITDFIGKGSFGVVFEAKSVKPGQRNQAVKIILVKNADEECKQYDIFDEFRRRDLKWVLHANLKFNYYFEKNQGSNESEEINGACVLLFDSGRHSFDVQIFNSASDDSNKKISIPDNERERNTRFLLEIIWMILQAFTEFHKNGYLHGDVKPQNLLLVETAGNHYEPRLIDFDLTFRPKEVMNEYRNHNPGHMTYTQNYRPPELLAYCNQINFPSHSSQIYLSKLLFKKRYSYSPEFKEDVWAVAQMIQNIYEVNFLFLNYQNAYLQYLFEVIITKMQEADIEKRWTMEQALEHFEFVTHKASAEKYGPLKLEQFKMFPNESENEVNLTKAVNEEHFREDEDEHDENIFKTITELPPETTDSTDSFASLPSIIKPTDFQKNPAPTMKEIPGRDNPEAAYTNDGAFKTITSLELPMKEIPGRDNPEEAYTNDGAFKTITSLDFLDKDDNKKDPPFTEDQHQLTGVRYDEPPIITVQPINQANNLPQKKQPNAATGTRLRKFKRPRYQFAANSINRKPVHIDRGVETRFKFRQGKWSKI
jgi:serine/threonine protein kinase